MASGNEAKRKEALKVYDFEVKRRTDIVIAEGLGAMEAGTSNSCQTSAAQVSSDHDWSIREASVRSLRALLARVEAAYQTLLSETTFRLAN